MPVMDALTKFRSVVSNDAYASTFQNVGQYRTSLLKHIDNQAAAEKLLLLKTETGSRMNNSHEMPLAVMAYPAAHPYPVAVLRVRQLEQALLSGIVVHLDALTTYTITANGGMRQDAQGPWVMKVDVTGHARSANQDTEALALFTGKMHERLALARKKGKYGWDLPSGCTVGSLARLLMLNVASGDHVSVANYAMMLEQRGTDSSVLPDALAYYVRQEAHPPICTRDSAETFAQALIAQGWHNGDEACVDGLEKLLTIFLTTQAAKVIA